MKRPATREEFWLMALLQYVILSFDHIALFGEGSLLIVFTKVGFGGVLSDQMLLFESLLSWC